MLVNIYRVVSVVHVIVDVICCGVAVGLCSLPDVTAAPSALVRKWVSAPRSTYYTAWEEVLAEYVVSVSVVLYADPDDDVLLAG